MISLYPGQVITPAAPAGLTFISQNQGQVVAAQSLSWKIFDITTAEKEQSGGTEIAAGTVDLDLDRVPFDPNNSTGYYVARWTVPSNAAEGRYQIEWTYVLTIPVSSTFTSISTEPAPAGTFRKTFEVLKRKFPFQGPQYALLTDVREELGCDSCAATDSRLHRTILLASMMIERITGRNFDAKPRFLRYSGNSSRKLLINTPIVGVSSVGLDTQPTQSGDLKIELELLRIYNRHLSQGMTMPDDRENPMLEFVHSDDLYGIRFVPFRGISLRSLAFPIGVQNCHVRGFFGYTDPDDSPWGETPLLIQQAVKLICARELPKIGDGDDREDAQNRWRVTQDKSRDMMLTLQEPRAWGGYYGDPEIDVILASYVRPPELGAA